MQKRQLVFHLGHSAGFYSEFNNMVLAILYCHKHNIDFKLYSADANFRVKNGWQDYFLPFCNESHNPVHHYINHRFEAPKGGKRKLICSLYRFIFPNTLLTSDLWNSFRHIDHEELTTSEVQQYSSDIINKIYRFNPSTQQKVDNLITSLGINTPYVGFHIRGGDKNTEHDLLSIDRYISRAEASTSIRQGFVFTDDYHFIESLRKNYPEWRFLTLTPPDDHGYFFSDFLKLSTQERDQRQINMFASIELLTRADLTFCTYSSNVGMFLGMRMGSRAIGIDMDNWMIW